MSVFRGLGSKFVFGWLIFVLAALPGQILDVVKGDVNHEHDKRGGTAGLNHADNSMADWLASNAFDEREEDMTAVEHWNREHVQECEVDVHEHAEPKGETPAFFAAEEAGINVHDFDCAAEMLGLDVRMAREQCAESVKHGIDAGGDLLDGAGMRQSDFAIGVPQDADARFFVRRADGLFRSHSDVRAFAISLDVKVQGFVRMIIDIFA